MTRARDIANLVDANGDIVAGALDNVPAADVVNDTTPQLGGNLDAQSNDITSVGNLGVGTASPSNKLSISSSTQYNGLNITNGTNTIAEVVGFGAGNDSGGIKLHDGGTGKVQILTNGASYFNGGDVGIGTSSPSAKLDVVGGNIRLNNNQGLEFGGGNNYIYGNETTDFIALATNGSEAMRIDSAARLNVGQSSASPGFGRINVLPINAVCLSTNDTVSYYPAAFYNNGNLVGHILSTASATSYVTSSDYRLKENVTADWDATTRLKQLNPVRFNFIANPDTTVDGFLAHEVQDIVPEAISGTKDAMRDEEYEVTPAVLDEDGNVVTPAVMGTRSVPDYQGIDQSKLVPLLVKTIQELEARITALETA